MDGPIQFVFWMNRLICYKLVILEISSALSCFTINQNLLLFNIAVSSSFSSSEKHFVQCLKKKYILAVVKSLSFPIVHLLAI